VDVPIRVTDSNGVDIAYSQALSVTVNIVGGTAPDAKVALNAEESTSALTVPLVAGAVTVTVSATGTGTVSLSLSDPGGNSLDLVDTALVTFS
jgi:hypothetical protein